MACIRVFTVAFCLSIATINCEECSCNKIPSIEIINDQQLANGIKEVRDQFLAKQPSSNFNRLSATILIRENNTKTWRRGSVDGTLTAYPASTIKLMYMYSDIEWCKSQDRGYVVDAIINTTNIDDLTSTNDIRWAHWFYQRSSTERLLQQLNLYENQVVRSKTYPTHSVQERVGNEAVLITSPLRSNRLQSCCTASFILYLMQTRPSNELQYIKDLLYRTLGSDHTTFGNGLPAGTILYLKSGNAYDTVGEIAYIILPTGQEIILSAFSNGFQRPASDFYILGRFAELVINKLSLNPPSTIIFTTDNQDIYTCRNDPIKHNSLLRKDNIGNSLITFNSSCIIHPILSERGVYTVSIWNPSYFNSLPNPTAGLESP